MKNERVMVSQFFWERIARLSEQNSWKIWKNYKGLEPGLKSGGTGSVIELAMAKEEQKKLTILRLD